jgi:putative transposase
MHSGMAESAASMAVRVLVATWPEDAPRGAVSAFCAEHGVSRAWFYKVRVLAGQQGALAATQRSRPVPKVSPNKVPPEVEELAVRTRKELEEEGWDCGPISVHDRMVTLGLPAPSRATLARIFTARGLVVPQPQKRPRSSYQRFVYPEPNGLWQLDGTEVALADGSKALALQVEDDHSRKILGSRACPSENAEDAWVVTEHAINRHGVPQRFLTDNGIALNPSRRGYLGLLTSKLQALGVNTIASTPGRPTTCGKNERLHSTLKKWLAARPAPADLTELQVLLEEFELAYNTTRGHQSLPGRCTPQQAWDATPKATEPDPPGPAPRHPTRPLAATLSGSPTAAGPLVKTITVDRQGHCRIQGLTVNLGISSPHREQQLIAVLDAVELQLFRADTGELLRTITLIDSSDYYGPAPTSGPQIRLAKVTASGQLKTFNVTIHIGSEHLGRQLRTVLDGDQIHIYDPASDTLLRDITLEPGRAYYGSGRPRGKRLPRVLSTKR